MARAKSERARSKTTAIDDLTQSIEQLQAFLPTVEDLGREGFPYLEGAKARTELQLRECIKRAFGDKSPEFQAHRHHKFSEPKQTAALIRSLVASLEDRKLELQGLKPTTPEPPQHPTEHARPSMTLVPPSTTPQAAAPSTTSSMMSAPPVILHVARTTTTEQAAAVPEPMTAPTAPPSPVEVSAASSSQSIPPRVPIEPISSLFRTQETKPMPTVPAPSAVAPPPSPSPPVLSPSEPTTKEAAPSRPTTTTTGSSPSAAPPVSAQTSLPEADHLSITKNICQRFHFVARQLRLRAEYRSSVSIEDESDVQDLLHALLRLQFDDISTDEWTPGYTNGASRTTFLLNHDRLAVVTKKTRAGLTMTDLKDQVRADIERYRGRGRCTSLLCFIYDPDGRIGNPRGLETELTSTSEQFTVEIVVAPK